MPIDGEDENIDEQKIIKQDLEVGTQVARGTNITLYIPEKLAKYPNFTDGTWTEERVKEFCKEYELNCEIKKSSNTEERDGTIISQTRTQGSEIVKGADLKIVIAEKLNEQPTQTDDIID